MPAPDPLDTREARKAGRPKSTGSLEPRPGRCGYKLRFTGSSPENPPRYCMMRPAPGGNGRCGRFGHNAWFTKGPGAHPTRATAKSLRAHAERLAEDPQLLSVVMEVATGRAIWQDLRDRMPVGAVVSAELLERIAACRDAEQRWRLTSGRGDAAAFQLALQKVYAAADPARLEVASRKELLAAMTATGRLADIETKRMETLQGMVTGKFAMAMVVRAVDLCVQTLERYVDEDRRREARRYLATEYERGFGRGGGAEAPAAGGPADAHLGDAAAGAPAD